MYIYNIYIYIYIFIYIHIYLSGSLLHLMRSLVRARGSTGATSLMHVQK